MTAKTLPRMVQTSPHWPAREVTQYVGEFEPCVHCDEEITFYYYGRSATGEQVHTGTDLVRCSTSGFSLAERRPRCTKCGSAAVTWTAEAWGDSVDCADCGHHEFHSIGD